MIEPCLAATILTASAPPSQQQVEDGSTGDHPAGMLERFDLSDDERHLILDLADLGLDGGAAACGWSRKWFRKRALGALDGIPKMA